MTNRSSNFRIRDLLHAQIHEVFRLRKDRRQESEHCARILLVRREDK